MQVTNSSLDTSKSILEFQLNMIKDAQDPLSAEIDELRNQVVHVVCELEKEREKNSTLEERLNQRQSKILSQEKESAALQRKARNLERQRNSIKQDLLELMRIGNAKTLQKALKTKFQSYVTGDKETFDEDTSEKQCSLPDDKGAELIPMEQLNEYKRRAARELKMAKQNASNKMADNVALLQDCNELRKSNETMKQENAALAQKFRMIACASNF